MKPIKLKAIELRKTGMSTTDIARTLAAPKSSVAYWVKNVVLSPESKDRLDKNFRLKCCAHHTKYRDSCRGEGFDKCSIDSNLNTTLWALGLALYWGEGTKSKCTCSITNSDPILLRWFRKFLVECLKVDISAINLTVYAYLDFGKTKPEITEYWEKSTGMVVHKFYKGQGKSKKKRNKNVFGVARLTVHNVKIVQNIYGAMGKIDPLLMERYSE